MTLQIGHMAGIAKALVGAELDSAAKGIEGKLVYVLHA